MFILKWILVILYFKSPFLSLCHIAYLLSLSLSTQSSVTSYFFALILCYIYFVFQRNEISLYSFSLSLQYSPTLFSVIIYYFNFHFLRNISEFLIFTFATFSNYFLFRRSYLLHFLLYSLIYSIGFIFVNSKISFYKLLQRPYSIC